MQKIKTQYNRSLKPIETEEPLALVFFRPLGFLFAMLLKPTPISANAVTIVSMGFGIMAGYHFFNAHAMEGALFLFIAHLLDCTDGQLARIRGTSSRLGKTLDGMADVITYLAIFAGVAHALSLSGPASRYHWSLYGIFAILNYLIHINLFDHFKNELIHYSIPEYHEKLEGVDRLKRIYRSLGRSLPARGYKIVLSLYIGFYLIEEAVIRLSLPNRYQGFLNWYFKENEIPQSVKDHFRTHYRRFNRHIVRGWSMLGATTHMSVFLICALLGRLDLIFWIIIIPFNIWTLILVAAQRWVIHIQLKRAFEAA